MIAYAVHGVWAALGATGLLLPARRDRLARLGIVLLLLAPLAVLAGTHSGGSDFSTYWRFFSRYPDLESVRPGSYPEVGFQVLLALANMAGLPYGIVFSVFAATAFGLIVVAVRRLGQNEALFFFLYMPKYFFQGHINQVRSSLVYPFVLLSVHWLSQDRPWRVVAVGLLLATVHSSALVLCLLPLLRWVPLDLRTLALAFVIPIALSLVTGPALNALWTLTGVRQLGYVAALHQTVSLFSVEVFRRMILFALVFFLVRAGEDEDPTVAWICKAYLLAWVFYVGFLDIRVVSDRLGAMFGVVEPLILLSVARLLAWRERPLWTLLVAGLGVAEFTLRAVVHNDAPLYVPYWRVLGG